MSLYAICTDGVIVCMCGHYMCNMPLAGCAPAVVHGYANIAKLWINLCHCLCLIISLHPPSYNITRCGFHMII